MSLDWSTRSCKDYEKLVWSTTNSLIWNTMRVGINKITDKNFEKFYIRLAIIERTFGTLLQKDGQAIYTTLKDVKDHIGMYTNVDNMSDSEFKKEVMDKLYRNAAEGMNK
jgi:hypothetical protein